MRILHVAWEAPPAVVGGLGRHVGRLAEAQARAGHPTTILTRDPGAAPPPTEVDAFVTWAKDHDREWLTREVVGDVVHGHDWLGAVAAKRIADRLGVPYVVTVHATEHGRHGGWVHTPPQSTIHRTERWMVRVAGAVVTCSAFMRDHVAATFGVAPPHVVPHGVAPPAAADPGADAALRARLAGPDERLVVLAGRLVYEKGLQVALAAHAALPGVRLAIAGAGPWEAALRAQAADGVTFLGHLADVGPLLRVADVVAVPSLYEPSGLVALEAMAAGTPCVVAATGGLRELPRDGVVRVAAGDADALAAGLRRALGDAALGPAAAAAVSGRRWAVTAEATLAVYRMAESP